MKASVRLFALLALAGLGSICYVGAAQRARSLDWTLLEPSGGESARWHGKGIRRCSVWFEGVGPVVWLMQMGIGGEWGRGGIGGSRSRDTDLIHVPGLQS